MSRSYKHSPYVVDNHSHNIRRKFMKRYVNKSLRNKLNNSDELIQGSEYKKHFDSWNICDYRWYWSENDAVNDYYDRIDDDRDRWFMKHYPTLESWIKYYRKCVVYK